ncbi:uncharacterized protein ACB058_019123 [Synchiropus picturatus]
MRLFTHPTGTSTMAAAKGTHWTDDEVETLLEIWGQNGIQEKLEKTHKNAEVFGQISDHLRRRGFLRTVDQCRDKVKKLRTRYMKTRQLGPSSHEKDKCRWYDTIDMIIGNKPPSQFVIESTGSSNDNRADSPPSVEVVANIKEEEEEEEEEGGEEEAEEVEDNLPPEPPRRKRKRQKDGGRLGEYKRLLEEFNRAEDMRQAKEDASLERWMKTLLETEERHFKMLLEHQAANNSMFINFMHMFMERMSPNAAPAAPQSPLPSRYHPPSPGPSEWTAQLSPSLLPSAVAPMNSAAAAQVSFQLCHNEDHHT